MKEIIHVIYEDGNEEDIHATSLALMFEDKYRKVKRAYLPSYFSKEGVVTVTKCLRQGKGGELQIHGRNKNKTYSEVPASVKINLPKDEQLIEEDDHD